MILFKNLCNFLYLLLPIILFVYAQFQIIRLKKLKADFIDTSANKVFGFTSDGEKYKLINARSYRSYVWKKSLITLPLVLSFLYFFRLINGFEFKDIHIFYLLLFICLLTLKSINRMFFNKEDILECNQFMISKFLILWKINLYLSLMQIAIFAVLDNRWLFTGGMQ